MNVVKLSEVRGRKDEFEQQRRVVVAALHAAAVEVRKLDAATVVDGTAYLFHQCWDPKPDN